MEAYSFASLRTSPNLDVRIAEGVVVEGTREEEEEREGGGGGGREEGRGVGREEEEGGRGVEGGIATVEERAASTTSRGTEEPMRWEDDESSGNGSASRCVVGSNRCSLVSDLATLCSNDTFGEFFLDLGFSDDCTSGVGVVDVDVAMIAPLSFSSPLLSSSPPPMSS